MSKLTTFFLILLLLLFLPSSILASDNNFGLHLTQTSDIHSATKIINSSNGDWGWTTIVIRTDQLDYNTWQDFFNNCRKYHIIPILRLASTMENNYWKRPSFSDIDNLANFLNTLNWPTKNQHIIVFNEINHAQEWGGEVDIKNFTDILIYTSKKFKSLNSNFIILSPGLDLAAPENLPQFKSAQNVYKEIIDYQPEYFENIDGISSHSYPNYGFIGTPKDTGQHSIQGYKWELDFLKKNNINKNFPIFITETGWPHREGEDQKNNFYTNKTTANFLKIAINLWSQDKNIKAITPFIYNYPSAPFDHFSWLDKSENLYPEYQQIIDIPKNQNKPEQTTKYEIVKIHIPIIIFTNTNYTGQIFLKNTGQSIWGETKFCLKSQATSNIELEQLCIGNTEILPNQIQIINFNFKVNKNSDSSLKNILNWENLPGFEITPFNKNATIYHPKIGILEKILDLYKNYLNKFISP